MYRDLKMHGHYCYVVNRYGLMVYDLADPGHPVRVGSVRTPGESEGLAIQEDRAYVAVGAAGLAIYSLADPIRLQFLGSLATDGTALDVKVYDTLACVTYSGQEGKIELFDVSNPEEIGLLSSLLFRSRVVNFAIEDSLLVVASGGYRFFSIANPRNPDSLTVFHAASGSFVLDGRYVYAYFSTDVLPVGVHTIDLNDMNNLQAYEGCQREAGDMVKPGDFIYTSQRGGRITIIDAFHPERLTVLGDYDDGYTDFIDAQDTICCASYYESVNYFKVYNVTAPWDVQRVAVERFNSYYTAVALNGDYAYLLNVGNNLANGPMTLSTVSLANPDSVIERDCIVVSEIGAVNAKFYRKDNYLYAIYGSGFWIFSIEEAAAPEYLDLAIVDGMGSDVGHVLGDGDVLYVPTNAGLNTVSIADRLHPVLLDQERDSVANHRMNLNLGDLDENYVYAIGMYALWVYRRAGDGTLTLHHTFTDIGVYGELEVEGDIGFTSRPIFQFNEDRTQIEVISQLRWSIALKRKMGDYLFGVDPENRFRAYNVADPLKPILVGLCGDHDGYGAIDVDMERGILASADGYSFGLWDFSDALGVEDRAGSITPQPLELTVTPNPSNSSTWIRFDLPRWSDLHLAIYDLSGREVALLADRRTEAGRHEITWDASTLPSGLYLLRLDSPEFHSSRKLVLVR